MKILYYGGQKSGKSREAERKALELTYDKKPYYIATYNDTYADEEMQERLWMHLWQREDRFETIEEPYDLPMVIEHRGTYLVECISMWILNTLDMPLKELLTQLEMLSKKEANIIFVLNNVNEGIIPLDPESRSFVDRTGVIGQKLAALCDEVYEIKLGIAQRIK